MGMDEDRSFIALVCGGIVGAAQLTVMWGLISSLVSPLSSSLMDMAGWIVLLVPSGALLGAAVAALLVRLEPSSEGWSSFRRAWGLATFSGFPVALIAPIALVGAGPDHHQYRFLAFIIQYALAWLAIFLLFRPRHREP